MIDQNRLKRLSIILFFLSLILLVIHMEAMLRFNRRELHIHGNDSVEGVQMTIDVRADSTSTWMKRSFAMEDGRDVNLIGQTIDGTLLNQSRDTIQDWELRLNIVGDCFINQAWNGEVEIHQFTGTDQETVQKMNLQNYQLEDVKFKYRYDGDLLIPLQQGDYVIYTPSTRFSEMPIAGGEDVKIGVIFYYLDELDLSNYELVLHFHRYFYQGITFYIFIAVVVLFLLSLIVTLADTLAYRRAIKEMELRKSGIFSMSDIYDLIYIIHLTTGEMTPVSVDDKIERDRPKNRTAKELLTDMILRDVEEKYRDLLLEFVDTDTLPERLKERNSVVSEFYSPRFGWCSIRFCAMDRVEGKPIENVVFTVQNINEEKKEKEAILQQMDKAESINRAKAAFMDNFADDLQRPLQNLVALNERILQHSSDASIQGYARSARYDASRLLMLTEGFVEGFGVESGKLQPASTGYSLRRLLTDTLQSLLPLAAENRIDMGLDVAETLPDGLRGDAGLLRQTLVNLISGLLPTAEGGRLQLAVYGKALEEKVHLLFSVRVFSDSARVGEGAGASGESDGATGLTGLSLEVVSSLLEGVGSALRTVRSPAGRGEFYFELEQAVLDSAPVGKLTVADANR